MDFERTEQERDAATRSHAFVEEILPGLPPHPLDFALAAHAALGARGFFADSSTVATVISVSALAAGSASLAAVAASGWLFADSIRRYGGSERASLGAAATTGAVVGCVSLEDPRGKNTVRAVHSESGLRVQGSVPLVANGPIATHAVVIVGTESAGLIALYLDETMIDARRAPPTTGLGFNRLPRCSLALDGLRLHAAAELAGTPGSALVDAGRLLTAAVALGLAERATTQALSSVGSQTVRPSQRTDFLLADLATELDAATLSVMHAAWLRDTGARHEAESAGGKLLATRTATRAVHGALGVIGEQGSNRLRSAYLDARALEMQSGDDRDQEDTMASVMLGER